MNNNYANPPLIVGLTGKREVGKSEVAKMFMERLGYTKAHVFAAGKAMCVTYYLRVGARFGCDMSVALRMVEGDLKDTPMPWLPGGVSSRYFMEKLGQFMGVQLGPEWTAGVEMDLVADHYKADKILLESVVYEANTIRSRGGVIVRIIRPNHEGVVGEQTDAVQADIVADHTIINDGTLDDLWHKVTQLNDQLILNDKIIAEHFAKSGRRDTGSYPYTKVGD